MGIRNPGPGLGPLFEEDWLAGLTGQPLAYRRDHTSQLVVGLDELFHLLLGVEDC